MAGLEAPEWATMFVPDLSLVEAFLRGTLIYLSLIVLFRTILKRQTGGLGLPDVLVVVLVSEAVSGVLAPQTRSLPTALVTTFALLFWSYALDRLAYRWPWLRRVLEPQPLELVRDGQPIQEHLDQEGIPDEELAAQLRLKGIEDVRQVKSAIMESQGQVSVIVLDAKPDDPLHEPPPPPHEGDLERVAQNFLIAAAQLQNAAAWHDARAEQHKNAAKAARELLTRHGVRARQALNPTTPSRYTHHEKAERTEAALPSADPAQARP